MSQPSECNLEIVGTDACRNGNSAIQGVCYGTVRTRGLALMVGGAPSDQSKAIGGVGCMITWK